MRGKASCPGKGTGDAAETTVAADNTDAASTAEDSGRPLFFLDTVGTLCAPVPAAAAAPLAASTEPAGLMAARPPADRGTAAGKVLAMQQTLGYTFKDVGLLELAVTHPSVPGSRSNASDHNQRLEFLGDAILQAVLSEALYRLFPEKDEGFLTNVRAGLVNGASLAAGGQRHT